MSLTLDNMDEELDVEHCPFAFREDKTEEGTHRWLKLWFEQEYQRAFPRYVMYQRYMNIYQNLNEHDAPYAQTSHRDGKKKKTKIKDNIVYSFTEQRVAQTSKQKISLAYIPRVQTDQKDINATKAAKLLVKARHEATDFDGTMVEMDRYTFLLGHTLYEEYWDKDCGPVAKSWESALGKYGDGFEYIEGDKTVKLNKNRPIKVGDTKGKLWMPYEFFPQPNRDTLKDADYIHTFEWRYTAEVESDYNLKKGTLKRAEFAKWDFTNGEVFHPENQILVHTFTHKKTKYLPQGARIVWCDDRILEWTDFPYECEGLNFIEDVDIRVKGKFWGKPFIVNIEQLYKVNNSVLTGQTRNHVAHSATKFVFPEGSIDLKHFSNEHGALPYRGAVEPKILQHQYVNRGEIDFQDRLIKRGGELSQVFEISRGYVPPGITAASAIRYLDEQEAQRATPTITKRKRRILDIVRLQLSVMAQNYKETDERTVRLVGENNRYIIKSFKQLALDRVAGVKLENTAAIGDTKTGAIADIIDLNASNQKDPVFGRKEIIKMLDLGLNDAFKEEISYAVDTAQTILDAILEGEQGIAPEATDGLIEHYHVFTRFTESVSFKLYLEGGIKKQIKDYILGLEVLMWEQAQKNMKFKMYLDGIEKFPMFFVPPTPPTPMPPMEGAPQTGGAVETDKMDFQKQQIEEQMKNEGSI